MGRIFKNSRKESVGKITVDDMIKYQIGSKTNCLDLNILKKY